MKDAKFLSSERGRLERSHAIPAYQLSDVPGREAKILWSATKTLPPQGMRLIGRLLLQNVESVGEDV